MNIRKIIASITLSVFTFFVLMPSIFGVVRATSYIGDETWFSPSFAHFIVKIWESDDDEIYGERYTYAQTHWIVWSLKSLFMLDNIERCVVAIAVAEGVISNIGAIAECSGELLLPSSWWDALTVYPESQPFASVIYQEMNNNPMSGVGYMSKKASKLGLVQEVHAQQGYGFSALAPAQELWQAVRNMTYFLLILVAIILAFMIMFRTKTSPQTVISVQSAIPKLVIALILITFSYAIAGLLVDLSYLLLAVFAMILTLPGMEILTHNNPATVFTAFLSSAPLLAMFFSLQLYTALLMVVLLIGGIIAIPFTGGGALAVLGPSSIVGSIFFVFILLFLIIIKVKIWWLLLRTFINVVLLTIVGPIYILMGTLPGSGGFAAWVRSLAAQLVVFPMVVIMLFLAHFFFWRLRTTTVIGDLLANHADRLNPYGINPSGDLSGTIGLPGFTMGTALMGFFGAFALLALTPHAANMIKSLVEGQPFGYGSAIGGAFGFAPWGARQGLGSADAYQARKASLAQEEYDLWRAGRDGARKPQKAHISEAAQRRRTMDYINRVRGWF